jgi:hypothetical protein
MSSHIKGIVYPFVREDELPYKDSRRPETLNPKSNNSNDHDVKIWDVRSTKGPLFSLSGHHLIPRYTPGPGAYTPNHEPFPSPHPHEGDGHQIPRFIFDSAISTRSSSSVNPKS